MFNDNKSKDDEILELISSPKTFEKGFSLLVKTYQEGLYWMLRKILIHHYDADEVLQLTFIKVFKNISKFKRESKLYTWMYRIANNEALNYIKKNKSLKITEIDNDNKYKQSEYVDFDKVKVILQKAIDTLPKKQRQVFMLKYIDDLEYDEISKITGTSVSGLKSNYYLAVKKIQSFLKNYE